LRVRLRIKIDFDFGDIELAEDIEKEDSIAINTVIGHDSSIIKIWIDTENENITHSMADSDFKVQPIYELPEIQSSEVVAHEQALENFKVKPAIRINVFPELPENAIGYQLQVNAENLKEQTKFVIRDMKASSKWVWIKNETSSSITFQNTFAGCDTLEFSPEVIGETNGDAITIPANGTYAFDMLTEQLKVNL